MSSKTAKASVATLSASPTSVTFGSVTVGVPATTKVSLTNSSSSAVIISKLAISGNAFTVDGEGTLPATIAANSSGSLNVHFGPTTTGISTGQLVITTNSLANPSITIQLGGTGVSAQSALSVNASSIAFGNVAINAPAIQPITLQSTGSGSVTVSSATVSGTGFTLSGGIFPLTLNPSQSATLNVQFDPTTTGAETGQLIIASNASNNPSIQVNLSGTGVAAAKGPYQVSLSWAAPANSSTTIAGYNIYRSQSGSSLYQMLNSGADSQTDYADSSVQSGSTYQYYVTSVDGTGAESVPSNVATLTVP